MIAAGAAPPPASAALSSEVPEPFRAAISAAAASCDGLAAPLLAAQLERESGWRADAVSPKGAVGLAQFMPPTWAAHGVDGDGDGSADPRNPHDAIASAAAYNCHLRHLLAAVPGDRDRLVLAAYNAGPYAVIAHAGVPPYEETRRYVEAVLSRATALSLAAPSTVDGLRPRAAAAREEVVRVFGVTDIGGFAQSGHVAGSDHYEGRAIDVMLTPLGPANTELGWRIATYLQSNAQRLGITYLIWQARIWSPARAAEGWRPYRHPSGRGGATLLHLDHVHASFAAE